MSTEHQIFFYKLQFSQQLNDVGIIYIPILQVNKLPGGEITHNPELEFKLRQLGSGFDFLIIKQNEEKFNYTMSSNSVIIFFSFSF